VSGSTGTEKYRTVVVNKGDTLWNIIKNNCSNYGDIRKAIFDVQKVSNLESANITPGQIIKIPEKYYQ
jgi:LysM repeat protein